MKYASFVLILAVAVLVFADHVEGGKRKKGKDKKERKGGFGDGAIKKVVEEAPENAKRTAKRAATELTEAEEEKIKDVIGNTMRRGRKWNSAPKEKEKKKERKEKKEE